MKKNKKLLFLIVLICIFIIIIALIACFVIKDYHDGQIGKSVTDPVGDEFSSIFLYRLSNDIVMKEHNPDWFSWQDLEISIAEHIIMGYKNGWTDSQVIRNAAEATVKDYFDNKAKDNTALTDEEVKFIIDKSVFNTQPQYFSRVTEKQIDTIINIVFADYDLTASKEEMQKIVDATNHGKMTAVIFAKNVYEICKKSAGKDKNIINTIISKLKKAKTDPLISENEYREITDNLFD